MKHDEMIRMGRWLGSSSSSSLPGRYWSDDSYQAFYDSNFEEQRIMKRGVGGAGCTSSTIARMTCPTKSSYGPSRVLDENIAPRPGEPSDRQLARFQATFAELSAGRGWIRVGEEAHQLLAKVRVNLSAQKMRELVQQVVEDEIEGCVPGRLSYEMAMRLYEQALFPEVVKSVIDIAIDGLEDEILGASDIVYPPSREVPSNAENRDRQRQEWPAFGSVSATGGICLATTSPAGTPRTRNIRTIPTSPCGQQPWNKSIFKKVGRLSLEPRTS